MCGLPSPTGVVAATRNLDATIPTSIKDQTRSSSALSIIRIGRGERHRIEAVGPSVTLRQVIERVVAEGLLVRRADIVNVLLND